MPKIDIFKNESEPVQIPSGETIFLESQPGDFLYAIVDGKVEIRKGEKVLALLGEGEIFGEMAMLDNSPRSASAIAQTDCKVVRVNQDRFLKLLIRTPFFAVEVMRVMSERLRQNIES
jgi:CRP/FNR family transcriptional regulator, cyclic AMP receptor protein